MFRTFDIAARRAELSPHKIALHELDTGQRLSYGELDRRARLFAETLPKLGIQRGDRIAIVCENCAAFFEILFGCAKAGVVLVPLNGQLCPATLAQRLADCSARLLLHDAASGETANALSECVPRVPILSALEPVTEGSYQALLAEARGEAVFATERAAGGLWYMLYTAGTTGQPKAVLQTFGMAWANYVNVSQALELTADTRTPAYLPLHQSAGINLAALPTLIAGGTVTLLPGFGADRLLDLIAKGEATALLGLPAMYQALSRHPRFADTDLSQVRSWTVGGGAMPEGLLRTYAARGVRISPSYWLTEAGPLVFHMDKADTLDKPGSVGKPQMLCEVRIIDPHGRDLPAGECGELLVLGPNVTPGYWNRPAAAAGAFDERGWLRTGDIGMRDEEGYFYIVNRLQTTVSVDDETVRPAQMEQAPVD